VRIAGKQHPYRHRPRARHRRPPRAEALRNHTARQRKDSHADRHYRHDQAARAKAEIEAFHDRRENRRGIEPRHRLRNQNRKQQKFDHPSVA
jgi:hypothetical protein